MKKDIKLGIGFATGRKSFQTILKTNIYNWRECGLTDKENITLNLFVAYDLKYSNTRASDYTNMNQKLLDLIDGTCFIGSGLLQREIEELHSNGILSKAETKLFFTSGYAAKRNSILYFALKNHMDYLIFLDDDEYPMAVTNSRTTALWGGQHVLMTHLRHIGNADITYGHHCGYISPIPQIAFDATLTEGDFQLFIEAISNDIVHWEKVKAVMENGGVTYADKGILITEAAEEVKEINGAKFISGSNLCINMTTPARVHPFYNPPKARGEDTFLSTCLSENKVLRVPCYTFHDAFSFYRPLMNGVLPISLQKINTDSAAVVTRFYKACIGWIRYKPLLLYITNPDQYDVKIAEMRKKLSSTLPKICKYFNNSDFMKVFDELDYYHLNVQAHHRDFIATQQIWIKLTKYLTT
ncbi:hypothetical protein CLHUN_16050 [Ruminiclostridium hungatei]|uniref:Uncharacterized protein n=1 Tax=Ruminiclostridium hungatei TaxID=48256 RepID=A0A1V4SN10_RUMHU|nr:hypothetical protein [Ruminiclostridium hungatei]OPX44611.1 hypothetical protein CLHUN_16050 [Ruminiclostridium hungatei]